MLQAKCNPRKLFSIDICRKLNSRISDGPPTYLEYYSHTYEILMDNPFKGASADIRKSKIIREKNPIQLSNPNGQLQKDATWMPRYEVGRIDGVYKVYILLRRVNFNEGNGGQEFLHSAIVADTIHHLCQSDKVKIMFIYEEKFQVLTELINSGNFDIDPYHSRKFKELECRFETLHISNKLHLKTVYESLDYFNVLSDVCQTQDTTMKCNRGSRPYYQIPDSKWMNFGCEFAGSSYAYKIENRINAKCKYSISILHVTDIAIGTGENREIAYIPVDACIYQHDCSQKNINLRQENRKILPKIAIQLEKMIEENPLFDENDLYKYVIETWPELDEAWVPSVKKLEVFIRRFRSNKDRKPKRKIQPNYKTMYSKPRKLIKTTSFEPLQAVVSNAGSGSPGQALQGQVPAINGMKDQLANQMVSQFTDELVEKESEEGPEKGPVTENENLTDNVVSVSIDQESIHQIEIKEEAPTEKPEPEMAPETKSPEPNRKRPRLDNIDPIHENDYIQDHNGPYVQNSPETQKLRAWLPHPVTGVLTPGWWTFTFDE